MCRKKNLSSRILVISDGAIAYKFELFLIFGIAKNEGLTVLSTKY